MRPFPRWPADRIRKPPSARRPCRKRSASPQLFHFLQESCDLRARADGEPDTSGNLVAAVAHQNAAVPQSVTDGNRAITRVEQDKVRVRWKIGDTEAFQAG